MKILYLGDVMGRAGRNAVKEHLPRLRKDWRLDFVVVNGENASNGMGLSGDHAKLLFEAGADCVTLGDHTFDQKDMMQYIQEDSRVIRPLNYAQGDPCPSSWGQGGYHNYWLNDSNAWVVPEWEHAGEAMVQRCSRGVAREADLQLLSQAARELLLAQSSDWSFILRAGTTTGLARERIERHLKRFWMLMAAMDGSGDLPEGWLEEVQADDRLFPLIQPLDWAKVGS